MALHHADRKRLAHTVKFLRSHRVLKARQRRLRCQIEAGNRIAVEQHLVHRVGSKPCRVIAVRITAGDREHALRQQLRQRMIYLACLPIVFQTPGQARDQSIAPVRALQQDRSAIGGALPLIKLQYRTLAKHIREQ
jgi:hypothetical protein